ncbi:MAG: hypothetical protein WD717_07240 [Nitrosarchaeum sp.]
MNEISFPPFLKWGKYKSEDKVNPDKIEIQVTETETFETEFGTNINAIVDEKEMAVPIQNFNSANTALLKLWNNNIQNGKIQEGVKFTLLTWMGMSKNSRKIRRWVMEFNS